MTARGGLIIKIEKIAREIEAIGIINNKNKNQLINLSILISTFFFITFTNKQKN